MLGTAEPKRPAILTDLPPMDFEFDHTAAVEAVEALERFMSESETFIHLDREHRKTLSHARLILDRLTEALGEHA